MLDKDVKKVHTHTPLCSQSAEST